MSNNINDKINDLMSLIEENEHLREECERLKKELDASTLNNNLTIDGYYLQKYEKKYEDALATRLGEIDLEINDYQAQIEKINNTLINIDQVIEENEAYQNEINELQLRFNDNVKQVEEKENELKLAKEKLANKQLILTNATIGYYNYIYKALNPLQDIETVNLNVSFVMTQLKEQLYDLVVDCAPLNFKIMSLESELLTLRSQVKFANEGIVNEQIDATLKIQSITEDELNQQKTSLNEKINQCVDLKKELSKTLEVIKGKDIEKIKDQINYLLIKDTPKEEISNVIESMIEEMANQLLSTDTLKNLKIAKQLRLSSLMEEKKQYVDLNKKHSLLKAIEDEYYSSYVEASNNLDKLVDYLDNADLAINENDHYKQVVSKYSELLIDKEQLNAQYELIVKSYNEQLKVRQDKALYANSDMEIKNLNHKINSLYAEKNRLQKALKDLNTQIVSLETNHDNITLMIVYKEKKAVEDKLPLIYDQLRELKVKVNSVKSQISDLNVKIKRLEAINKEIEQLVYEINN